MRYRLGLGSHFAALIRRPRLWLEAFRLIVATRRRGRPWPSAAYLLWRSQTAYGEVIPIPTDDLVAFLSWRRVMRRSTRGTRSP